MQQDTTEWLEATPAGYARAVALWQDGAVVAFPTETVYGLGADAGNDRAVARIFAAKNRPQANPLIVHAPSIAAVRRYAYWNPQAERLAHAFWPGPLTLVLPLHPQAELSPLVVAGRKTVALRVPRHPVAQALLRAVQRPIAAPSANLSGRVSPSTAAHVAATMKGRIAAIVAAGAAEIGLESTIIGLWEAPVLLRPGGIPLEAIQAVLGYTPRPYHGEGGAVVAPGQLPCHYAPKVPLRMNARKVRPGEVLLGFGAIECHLNLSARGDLAEAAAKLYTCLHRLDAACPAGGIAVSPVPNHGLGRAINDRLRRAAASAGTRAECQTAPE
ncbi:MAG: threonylcarbamoyl-AMP synthase, partial [Rhodobacteraceae bacterium]|nr:threonylcarbamoyl-AMP synthase [Paracoccaceae bacterium]